MVSALHVSTRLVCTRSTFQVFWVEGLMPRRSRRLTDALQTIVPTKIPGPVEQSTYRPHCPQVRIHLCPAA